MAGLSVLSIGEKLLLLTRGLHTQDVDYLDESRTKLQEALDDRSTLPYLVRRSILSSGRPKTTTEALAYEVKRLIWQNRAPMTSREIYPQLSRATAERYADIKSFRSALARTTGLVDRPIEPTRHGHELVWDGRRVQPGRLTAQSY